jgi:uncharacterized membrane protein
MSLLILILVVAIVGTFLAVPLFEFVVASLLLTPLLRFLLGWGLLVTGHDIAGAGAGQLFYLFCFGVVAAGAFAAFGARKTKLTASDCYPLIAFAAIYLLAYVLCSRWFDFYDLGERLRDYSLIASAIDSPVIPKEPWMEGATLNYYVYWYRFAAMLTSVLSMGAWDAYHTIVSFSIALYGAVIFQIIRVVFAGSISLAALGAILIPFGPNVAGMLTLKRGQNGSFERDEGWWGPSRVIQGAIDEFPAWSFILGDAHPHYLNLATFPFLLLLLYRIATSGAAVGYRFIQSTLLIVAGALFLVGSNAWEVPMWAGTAAIIGLTALIVFRVPLASLLKLPKSTSTEGPTLTSFDTMRQVASIAVLLVALGVVVIQRKSASLGQSATILLGAAVFALLFYPRNVPMASWMRRISWQPRYSGWVIFWSLLLVALKLSSSHIKPEGGNLEFVSSPIAVTTTAEIFAHWGTQLVLIAVGSLLLWRFSLASFMLGVFLVCTLFYDKAALFIYVLIGIQLIRLLRERSTPGTWREVFGEGLIIASLGLVLLPEIVFLNDSYGGDIERMNTIFKIYTTAWALLGLCAIYLLGKVSEMRSKELNAVAPGASIVAGLMIVSVLCVGTSIFYAHVLPMREMKASPVYGSEGLGLADNKFPGSGEIIRTLRTKPYGRVLETQGRPYSFTSFVSTLAGQPAYLGWANHVNLLTKRGGDIAQREKVTDDFYKETDCSARRGLAQREQIRYVVVGSLEKSKYPGVYELDFSCFTTLAKKGDYSLYQTP